jgi:hypothetical protein
MFFRKSEKRAHPYFAMTVGTLAMIGAARVVKCAKRASRCMRGKMSVVLRRSGRDTDAMT